MPNGGLSGHTPPLSGDMARQLHSQQLSLLYGQTQAALGGAVVVALFTVFLLQEQAPLPHLLWWLAAVLVVYALRYILILRCKRRVITDYCRPRATRRFLAGAFSAGLVWGLGSVYLFPYHSIAHQAFLILVVGGLSAASTVSCAALRWASAIYIVPTLLPLSLRFLSLGDSVHTSMGILMLVFTGILLVVQENAYRATMNSLRLGIEKGALAEKLQQEVDERRRTEQSLLASQKRLTEAQRIAGFGNWEWDVHADEIIWSEETYRIFRLEPSPEPIRLQTYLARIHPDDRHLVAEAMESAQASRRPFGMDYRIVWPDGTVRYVHDEGEARQDADGQLIAMAGVLQDITERVTAEERIKKSERELSRILENLQDVYYRLDLNGFVTRISPSVERVFGFSRDECLGTPVSAYYVGPEEHERFLKCLDEAGGALLNYEAGMRHRDGTTVWVSINAQYVRNAQGEVVALEGIARDITQLKGAEEALYTEKERALVTLESIGDGVLTTDRDGVIDYVNPVAERLLGQSADAVLGRNYLDVLNLVDDVTGESLDDLVKLCLTPEGGVVHANDGRLSHLDGTEYNIKISAAAMRDSHGELVGAALVLHDITEVARMARQLSYQATHDMLTGLVNRREFETRVERVIAEAQTHHSNHVLFYLDLDQFKLVNDTCGHRAGDLLLEQLATLMRGQVRDSDTVARLGGDEFGVLLENCPLDKAEAIAEELRRTVHEFRFVWDGKTFDIGVSIGVVPVNRSSGRLIDVLSAADAACYIAKDLGRNRVHLYTPDDNAVVKHHGEMEWVHRISSAFDEDRFLLYAQPVVRLEGDRAISHYEILMRMKDEQGEVVPPGAFIPAAERYNLMPTLDRWVIRTTLGFLREAQGPGAEPPVRCAINLSGQTLCDDHFLDFVVDQFDFTGIPGDAICFEITETAAIANLTRAMRFISILKGMGCTFALDDFGSGLSSFGYLKNLSVNYLKIDGSFVRDMVNDSVDRAMVASINQMGHVMGLQTIAEFVEDDAIIGALKSLGVDFGQGYGIERPHRFDALLRERRPTAKVIPLTGA